MTPVSRSSSTGDKILPSPEMIAGVSPTSTRLDSIDLLRGLVMVVMALDHVRDFFTDVRFYPLDLSQTNVPLALTRWITHFCAPIFVFLAGTGAYLSFQRGRSRASLSQFLLTRGIWVVILELTLVRFGWKFNFDYSYTFGQVIWAIGWSMIVLSGLVYAPRWFITAFGVVMIASHNAFDWVDSAQLGLFGWPWQILHAGGEIHYGSNLIFDVRYPLIPWIGVMATGFGFGKVFSFEERRRRRLLLQMGIGITAAFILLRWSNLYGDPGPWLPQKNIAFTILSFINCEKYPPSLLYLMMTLGPAMIALSLFEKWKGKAAQFFVIFGRVPMFYYLLHLPFIHLLAIIAGLATVNTIGFMFSNNDVSSGPAEYGFSLPVVYLVWATVIAGLYPACRWFSEVKRRRKDAWLSYL